MKYDKTKGEKMGEAQPEQELQAVKSTQDLERPQILESAKTLLYEFEQEPQPQGEFLNIQTSGDEAILSVAAPHKVNSETVLAVNIFNTAAPIMIDGRRVLVGRVESPDNEFAYETAFFEEHEGKWIRLKDSPIFKLQDPNLCRIDDEIVLIGVEARPDPERPGFAKWETVFFRGNHLNSMKEFARSPQGMKDIRVIKLKSGKIGVFTRPQGKTEEEGGRGKIGYTEIDSLDQLNIDAIRQAQIIEGQFVQGEWGGANALYLLGDGKIAVLGHIAYLDEKMNKHYYAMIFTFDPETRYASPVQIIATRSNFPDAPTDHTELSDIFYPGGLELDDPILSLEKSEHFWVYGGASDKYGARVRRKNPLFKSELKGIH